MLEVRGFPAFPFFCQFISVSDSLIFMLSLHLILGMEGGGGRQERVREQGGPGSSFPYLANLLAYSPSMFIQRSR